MQQGEALGKKTIKNQQQGVFSLIYLFFLFFGVYPLARIAETDSARHVSPTQVPKKKTLEKS
jgi:hypothetical protein